VPTNYLRILIKNADKIHKNISASKMYKNLADGKILAASEN
jgi:hypothetical protein